MAKTYDNIRVYGDSDSAVYVATKGATLPVGLASPAEPWVELGWLSDDGISASRDEDATSFTAYQGGAIVRRKTTKVEDSFKFQCLEETATTLGLYYKGQEFSKAAADAEFATLDVTNQTASDDRAFVIDVVDGANTKRYLVSAGAIGVGDVAHSNTDMTVYEFTVTVQGDYKILSNNAGVLEAASVAGA